MMRASPSDLLYCYLARVFTFCANVINLSIIFAVITMLTEYLINFSKL